MSIDTRSIEVMDDRVAAVMRRKSPSESLQLLEQLFVESRELIRGEVRRLHPEWPRERVHLEVLRRMHGDSIPADHPLYRRLSRMGAA